MTKYRYSDRYQGGERKSKAIVEQLKEKAEIDRTETCYAGKGGIYSDIIVPMPEHLKALRRQKFL